MFIVRHISVLCSTLCHHTAALLVHKYLIFFLAIREQFVDKFLWSFLYNAVWFIVELLPYQWESKDHICMPATAIHKQLTWPAARYFFPYISICSLLICWLAFCHAFITIKWWWWWCLSSDHIICIASSLSIVNNCLFASFSGLHATSTIGSILWESTTEWCLHFMQQLVTSSVQQLSYLIMLYHCLMCACMFLLVCDYIECLFQIQSCRLKHVESLWLLLSYMRSRMQANNGQVHQLLFSFS